MLFEEILWLREEYLGTIVKWSKIYNKLIVNVLKISYLWYKEKDSPEHRRKVNFGGIVSRKYDVKSTKICWDYTKSPVLGVQFLWTVPGNVWAQLTGQDEEDPPASQDGRELRAREKKHEKQVRDKNTHEDGRALVFSLKEEIYLTEKSTKKKCLVFKYPSLKMKLSWFVREALAHGADALAAARCAWGVGGSNGRRPFVLEAVEKDN